MDYRNELLNKILLMCNDAGITGIEVLKSILIQAIGDYEITERCTDIVVLDDTNERIIKTFLATKKIEGGSDETAKTRWYIIRKFNDDINKPFHEITTFDILHWLSNTQKRVSLNTTDSYRNMLSSLFSWMFKNKIIPSNPMEFVQPIKHSNVIKTAFNPVEIDSMRSACKKLLERTIFELLLSSGLRCEELCNLKWTDVDFTTKDVTVVEGKGRKNRVTMMDDVARKYLLEYRDKRKTDSEYIFAVNYRKVSKPRSTDSVWRLLKVLAERANVTNVHPHKFRYTFATVLYKRGMDLRMIQKLLGHSNINTTMIYIDSDLDMVRDAYKKCVV